MNCLDIQERIVDLLLGQIDPAEKALILEHIARCPLCAEDFNFLSECINVCACPEFEEIDETYWEEFVVAVHQKISYEKPKPKFPYRTIIPIALSAVGAFGVIYLLFLRPQTREIAQPKGPEIQPDPYQEIYELTPEQQKEFIKMINQKYFGE